MHLDGIFPFPYERKDLCNGSEDRQSKDQSAPTTPSTSVRSHHTPTATIAAGIT